MFGFGKKTTTTPKAAQLLPPTQDHLHIRGVVDGVIVSDDGTMAKVMEIEPVDLLAMGQAERERYRMSFSRAVASIRAPLAIQVVIASQPQTCKEYLKRLKKRANDMAQSAALETDQSERQRRKEMAHRARRWSAFIETQLTYVRPLEEQYLVVVWHNPFPLKAKRRVLSQDKFEAGKQELIRRFGLVRDVFQNADLQVRELDDNALLAVVYRFYHWSLSPQGIGVEPRVRSMQPSLYVGAGDEPDGDLSFTTEEEYGYR